MKLILFNFEMNKNSQALAFALDWVNEIAKNVDKLYVVSLRCGEYKVNDNIEVYCINQDKKSRLQTILSIWKVLKQIHKKDKIDGYFVHMAHYFVPIIYPFAKWYNQRIVLWYAHKAIPFSLKIAVKLSDLVVSVSSKSMQIKTSKFKAIGHGIYINRFQKENKFHSKIKNIITVGRISKVKNTYQIVKSFLELQRDDLKLYIVGDTLGKEDEVYLEKIKKIITKEKNIIFTGSIPFTEIVNYYDKVDLAINLGDGALDKTIIEPMAMGIPVITSNESAKELFKHLDGKGIFLINKDDLTKALQKVINIDFKDINREVLRKEIIKNHSLAKLAKKIVGEFR